MGSITEHTVPVVDLSSFKVGGDLNSRKQAARDLAAKGQINGCVGISGHGVSPELLKRAFEVTKNLFDLPYQEKMKAPHPDGVVPHRGYSGVGREKGAAKTATETDDEAKKDAYLNASDYKESYEIGSEENKVQYNIWLPEEVLPGFRSFTTELYWELKKTADSILEALIMSLNLQDNEVESVRALHTGHDNQLRLMHYPAISTEMLKQKDIGRLGAHSDWTLFTLLFQDISAGTRGLEFLDIKSDTFMPAIPKEGLLYMNIGDMFQRLSNGLYPTALHRVVISGQTKGEATPPRYSIPYFVPPLSDIMIEPQPSLVKAMGKQNFEPVTFEDYATKMFETTQLRDPKE